MKFQRTYTMQVEQFSASVGSDGVVVSNPTIWAVIPPELSVEFTVERVSLSEAAHATFRLYNVPTDVAHTLLKDYFNGQDVRGIIFNAGYVGSPLPRVFNGQLINVSVSRSSGGVDNILDITAIDTGWDRNYACCIKNGEPLPPFPIGTSVAQKIITLASCMPNVSPNIVIGKEFFNIRSTRADTYTGPVWPIICELSGNKAVIDDGILTVLGDYDVVPTTTTFTLDDTVILGAPKRSQQTLEVDVIFETAIRIGMCVTVSSDIAPEYNGNWKVFSISHKGNISPAVDTGCVTSLTLWKGQGQSPSLQGATSTAGQFYPLLKV